MSLFVHRLPTPPPCALCPVVVVLSRSLGANLLVYQMYALINLVPPSKSLIDCDSLSDKHMYSTDSYTHTCLLSDRDYYY